MQGTGWLEERSRGLNGCTAGGSVVDKEGESRSGRSWATLLLSCLLIGLEEKAPSYYS